MAAVDYDSTQQSGMLSSTPAQKRKLGQTDFEIADSDDEDYGWDDDEELPPMPSQWQGSEDLLLVRQPETDVEDQDEDATPEVPEGEDAEPASGIGRPEDGLIPE